MENKNNKIIIVIMGVIIIILAILCILFATNTITFNTKVNSNTKENLNNKSNNNNDNINSTNENNNNNTTTNNDTLTNCDEIIGSYEFEEAIPSGADAGEMTSAEWTYDLNIVNSNNECQATLEINGFQTMEKYNLKIRKNDNKYSFIYDSDVLEKDYHRYKSEDVLFYMYNKEDSLYTSWNLLKPNVDSNKEDGIYFNKK